MSLLGVRHSLTTRSLYPFVLGAMAEIPRADRARLRVLDMPAGSGVLSYPLAAGGFDVTPADLVSAIVTDRGVVPPGQLSRLMD